MSRNMSTSPGAQPGMLDTQFDALIDYTEYENTSFGRSPALSPNPQKPQYAARPAVKPEASTVASIMPSPQPMSGPSHQYDLYKQQTGLVPGALASTLAVNQNNSQIQGYSAFNAMEYLGMSQADMFDFNTSPSQGLTSPDLDNMDFESSPSDSQLFFESATIDPHSLASQHQEQTMPSPPTTQSAVGRMWPGMHQQQAALAKAQAQQRQQQQIIQQQQQAQQHRQRQSISSQGKQPQRSKAAQPSDPIVEQKITQLLNTMRAQPSLPAGMNGAMHNVPRPRKDEDDMDEDERLLASEEGKKLTSKERRQLRNKVSARAFRSRRKEYIGQLEAEIANKVTENGDLRAQNRALIDENKRLTDLTRMLLASPSFSDFLNHLSTNPQMLPQAPQPQAQPQQQQPPKDVNPYAAQQMHQPQIGLVMVPEPSLDFGMMNLNGGDGFNYQPQVYAVTEVPEVPALDLSMLSGKTSNFVGESFDSEDDKVEVPAITEPLTEVTELKQEEVCSSAAAVVADEEFENDPSVALYHETVATATSDVEETKHEIDMDSLLNIDIFGGVHVEKVYARYELVDAAEEEATAALAMARVQRLTAALESTVARLELLTCDL